MVKKVKCCRDWRRTLRIVKKDLKLNAKIRRVKHDKEIWDKKGTIQER